MPKPVFTEPSEINSSYVVLFHATTIGLAPLVVSRFPAELTRDAVMVAIIIPICIFWFSYLLKQFASSTIILRIIFCVAFVIAGLSLLNAIYGELSGETVPVIYTRVPFFATLAAGLSGPIGLIYAGTIITYGMYAYIASLIIASLLEAVYGNSVAKILPRSVQKQLQRIDGAVDRGALRRSDSYFVYNQRIGIAMCGVFVLIYAIIYIYLLIL